MTATDLQKQLEKERASLKAANDLIAAQKKEIEVLKNTIAGTKDGDDALTDANILLSELINNLQNGVFVTDARGKIIILNEVFCRLFGIQALPEYLVETDANKLFEQVKDLMKEPNKSFSRIESILKSAKKVLNEEIKLANGHILNCDFIPFFSEGNYKGLLWKCSDITREKIIKDTFESQRKFYEQVLSKVPADIVVCDAQHRYLYINPTAISTPELRKWMIGKTNKEFCDYTKRPIELAENRERIFQEVKKTKTQKEWEETFILPDGGIKYHLRRMFPVLDDNGELEMVIGYGVDITERRKIEEQIHFSEKRYREIFNYSQAWICTHDMQGKMLSINPAACKLLGYEEADLLGKKIDALIPEKVRSQFSDRYMKKIMEDGKAEGIMSVINGNGKNMYLLYHNHLVEEKGEEPYVIGFAQDITQRLYAEEALKRSEEKYKSIIENMNLGMMEIDTREKIIYANQRFCMMSGYELDELIGKKATDLFLRGASLKRTKNRLSKGALEITASYELEVKTKNGENRWWLTSATPLYNPDESSKGTISIHLDITDQKKMEEQLRVAKLDADRSSRSKDVFLTNMSHEIRTPLNAIMGLGKLLSKSTLDAQQKNYLTGIESASVNLLSIINDLLDLSKIEAGKITLEHISFNLDSLSKQAIMILSHKAEEKGLLLASEVDPNIAPALIGDPFRINQVFMNMLSNAIKFTESGSVYLKAFLLGEEQGWQRILVVIEDTGVGIKEEYLNNIFDKFTQEDETVGRKFGGTGLGMGITKQLMELMGGQMSLNSKKNVGTTISLTFKFKVDTTLKTEKKRPVKNNTSSINNKRILLVEDNNLNRLLAYTILTDYGAIVYEAENGLQAIEQMKKEQFDMILMDIQMPVMDGIQATKIIRSEINKTIPILALTANAIKGRENQFTDAGMNDFIFKPYNEINLITPITKWLGSPGDNLPVNDNDIQDMASIPEEENVAEQGALYNLEKLFKISMDDNEFIKKMLTLFITETPPSIEKITEGYKAGDFAAVKYYAHRIKPSITNLGIESLKDDIVKIELATEQSEEMQARVEKLEQTIDHVIRQLRAKYNI